MRENTRNIDNCLQRMEIWICKIKSKENRRRKKII